MATLTRTHKPQPLRSRLALAAIIAAGVAVYGCAGRPAAVDSEWRAEVLQALRAAYLAGGR